MADADLAANAMVVAFVVVVASLRVGVVSLLLLVAILKEEVQPVVVGV